MKRFTLLSLIMIGTFASGCASIVNGTNQSVSVDTHHQGQPVAGARCELKNDKGTWYVTSPGSTVVNRSYEDLAVKCEKEGTEPGLASAKSSTKAMAFGNIIFGGVIGAGIDIASGSAYDYPNLITVHLGDTITIPGIHKNPEQAQEAEAAKTEAGTQPAQEQAKQEGAVIAEN